MAAQRQLVRSQRNGILSRIPGNAGVRDRQPHLREERDPPGQPQAVHHCRSSRVGAKQMYPVGANRRTSRGSASQTLPTGERLRWRWGIARMCNGAALAEAVPPTMNEESATAHGTE
jgi:hypothetical protein